MKGLEKARSWYKRADKRVLVAVGTLFIILSYLLVSNFVLHKPIGSKFKSLSNSIDLETAYSEYGCMGNIVNKFLTNKVDNVNIKSEEIVALFQENTQFIGISQADVINFLSKRDGILTDHEHIQRFRIKETDLENLKIKIQFSYISSDTKEEFINDFEIKFDDKNDGTKCLIDSFSMIHSYNGCFDADSFVYRLNNNNNNNNNNNIEMVKLRDIKIDDMIMSDINGKFSKVIYRLHYIDKPNRSNILSMIKFCFNNNNNDCLIASPLHLLFVNGIELDNLIPSKYVNLEDVMYTKNETIPVKLLCLCSIYPKL